jgi:uncharacterized protein
VSTGEVLELWRYPVKSMRGEALSATRLDATGVLGDRAHALVHDRNGTIKPLTAREAPALLGWRAAYPFAPDAALRGDPPVAMLTGPDGRGHRWGDPRLRSALQRHLGREDFQFRREPGGALHDLPRTLLVTFEASRRELERELGETLDLRRFRTNVHVEMEAPAWAEHQWEGATLTFASGVRLRLLNPCERCVIPTIDPVSLEKSPELLRHLAAAHDQCFGLNARVITGGRIAVGERVGMIGR